MPKIFVLSPAEAGRFLLVSAVLSTALSSALAHGTLESASPANGSTLATPPAEIRLTFSEQLQPSHTSVKLLNASGEELATPAKARVEGGKTVVLTLPTLLQGHYKAHWMTVGHDGHHVDGDLDFTVK